MGTTNPRINVTLGDDDFKLVKRVSEISNVSMAAVLREYVEMSRPMLAHMVELADALDQAQADRRDVHAEAVERAMRKGESMAEGFGAKIVPLIDWGSLLDGQGVNALTQGEGAARSTPNPTNRGVRSADKPSQGGAEGHRP